MLRRFKERVAMWARDHIHPDVRKHWKRMASMWTMAGAAGLSGLLAIWTYFEGKVPDVVYIGMAVLGPIAVFFARSWNQNLGVEDRSYDGDA